MKTALLAFLHRRLLSGKISTEGGMVSTVGIGIRTTPVYVSVYGCRFVWPTLSVAVEKSVVRMIVSAVESMVLVAWVEVKIERDVRPCAFISVKVTICWITTSTFPLLQVSTED